MENTSLLTLPGLGESARFLSPLATRRPERYDVRSPRSAHVPALMTLVDALRPRLIVELGVGPGVSYCALCQAVKELRLPTRCVAVDAWAGPPAAAFSTSETWDDLRTHHDPRYGLFSELLRLRPSAAVGRFDDGAIDLLLLDGGQAYETVKSDFEDWRSKLSPRGMVLIHGAARGRAERGGGRLWEELAARYPSFLFPHSHGLGLAGVGEDVPVPLAGLFELGPDEAERARQFYANLGGRWVELQRAVVRVDNMREVLHAATEDCRRFSARQVEETRIAAGLAEELRAIRDRHASLRYRLAEAGFRFLKRLPRVTGMLRSGLRLIKR